MKVYLAVPFAEKDEAKLLGAKWDPVVKSWFALNGESQLIQRWSLNSLSIEKLIGEERNFGGNKLHIDLIPKSCWFTNVRKCILAADWDRLRHFIYERANEKCECCGSNSTLDAHERWHYNENNKTQKLMRIIALCKPCHEVTHFGLAQIRKREEIAKHHLMKVTSMSYSDVEKHICDAFNKWEYRNQFNWKLDLSIIVNSGIKLAKNFDVIARKSIANDETLQIRSVERGQLKNYIGHLFREEE